jgi:hypothetical protein
MLRVPVGVTVGVVVMVGVSVREGVRVMVSVGNWATVGTGRLAGWVADTYMPPPQNTRSTRPILSRQLRQPEPGSG